jgi:hypothetical protein
MLKYYEHVYFNCMNVMNVWFMLEYYVDVLMDFYIC